MTGTVRPQRAIAAQQFEGRQGDLGARAGHGAHCAVRGNPDREPLGRRRLRVAARVGRELNEHPALASAGRSSTTVRSTSSRKGSNSTRQGLTARTSILVGAGAESAFGQISTGGQIPRSTTVGRASTRLMKLRRPKRASWETRLEPYCHRAGREYQQVNAGRRGSGRDPSARQLQQNDASAYVRTRTTGEGRTTKALTSRPADEQARVAALVTRPSTVQPCHRPARVHASVTTCRF